MSDSVFYKWQLALGWLFRLSEIVDGARLLPQLTPITTRANLLTSIGYPHAMIFPTNASHVLASGVISKLHPFYIMLVWRRPYLSDPPPWCP